MIRRPPRSTLSSSSAASDVYKRQEEHHALQIPGHAAGHRRQYETGDREQEKPSSPEAVGEIAGERHDHGGCHDIGGEHPGDLVGRRAEGAQHMGHRHVDNGYVQDFEDRGQNHRDDKRDRRAIGCGTRWGRWRWRIAPLRRRLAASVLRARPVLAAHCPPSVVSTVTSALEPTRNGLSASGLLVILTRTGKRWVTLTQLPVAFSGGSTEKMAPEPALMLSTMPSSEVPGYMSRRMVAGLSLIHISEPTRLG